MQAAAEQTGHKFLYRTELPRSDTRYQHACAHPEACQASGAHTAGPGAAAAQGAHVGAYREPAQSPARTLCRAVVTAPSCRRLVQGQGTDPAYPCPTSAPACFAAPFSVGAVATPATAPAAAHRFVFIKTFLVFQAYGYTRLLHNHMVCGLVNEVPSALLHARPALLRKSSTCRSDAVAIRAVDQLWFGKQVCRQGTLRS